MGWIDTALESVAPAIALRRLRTRHQLDLAKRAYDAADRGRHSDGWPVRTTSADTEIAENAGILRERSRDLVRNNAYAAKAVTAWVNAIVGEGIMPRPKTGNADRDAEIRALFDRWTKYADADGRSFQEAQQLACREMVEAGEALVRRRWRRIGDGLEVPMQVQVVEPDLLDSAKHTDLPNGRAIVQGIEFTPIGERAAYWMFRAHPGDSLPFRGLGVGASWDSVPVPASEVAHLFERQRTQVRGVPWGAPAMRPMRDLQDVEFAEIVRKKIECSVVGVVMGDEAETGIGEPVSPGLTNSAGLPVEKMQPGLFVYAKGTKDVKFNSPTMIGGYADYKSAMIHTIAAGWRMPYEIISGDLSQVNYSSIRAGMLEFRRLVNSAQWQIFIPLFCERVWAWFCEVAYTAGKVYSPVINVEWDCPKFEWVDPLKDVQADILAIRSGIKTWPQVIAERGYDWAEQVKEIAAASAAFDAAGIVLDIDPRKVVQTGKLQDGGQVASDDDEAAPRSARSGQAA